MAKGTNSKQDSLYDQKINQLKRRKPLVYGALGLAALGLIATAVSNLTTIIDTASSLFKKEPPVITGSVTIEPAESGYLQVGGTDARYPAFVQSRNLPLFRLADDLEWLVLASRSRDAPSNFEFRSDTLHHDPLESDRLKRLLLNGAIVLDYVRDGYKSLNTRTPELDDVFDLKSPSTGGMDANYRRIRSFLSKLYAPPFATTRQERKLPARIVEAVNSAWPKPEQYKDEDDEYRDLFPLFRKLFLRQTDPILSLTLKNEGTAPAIINAIGLTVLEFHPMKDSTDSGEVELLGSVTFTLDGTLQQIEASTKNGNLRLQKIAPKDAGRYLVRLKSRTKGLYRLVLSAQDDVGNLVFSSPEFLVLF